MKGFVRFVLLFSLLDSAGIARAAPNDTAVIGETMSIAEAQTVIRDEPHAARIVSIRGTVTWCKLPLQDFPRPHLVVQDDSAGIWVNVKQARARDLWQEDEFPRVDVGDVITVSGMMDRGGFAATILPTKITRIGKAPLPLPESAVDGDFFRGGCQGRRVTVDGIVQDARYVEDAGWILALARRGRRFFAVVPAAVVGTEGVGLVDAEVQLSGVATSTFNTRGQFRYPRVLVASAAEFTIERNSPADPFNAFAVDLAELGHHSPQGPTDHRVRVSGIVTQSQANGRLTVQQGRVGVRVQALEAGDIRPGDHVEIAGFVDRSRDFASLKAAMVRKTSTGSPLHPIRVTPREIIDVLVQAIDAGEMARPGDYDGCLIECEGTVGDVQRSASGIVVTLLVDETPLDVLIDRQLSPLPQFLESGCRLSATGILEISLQPPFERLATAGDSEAKRVERLTLLPRSPADLVVIKPAPWWNARRLAVAAGALASVLIAAVAWAALLRRRVAIETARATQEIRRRHDAEIEFEASIRERNRLAANLHDTLLQTLGGAGFQLDTCRRAVARADLADTSTHLDVARRMLKHAASELRGSVWALRTTPLAGKSFTESLSGIVAHLQQGQSVRIELDVMGEPVELPDFVAGNLLLVAQEAIRNALHHALPSAVRVAVAFDDATHSLTLTVSDDGRGFDTAAAAGPTQGHFGIQGMRERIGSLGGLVAIDSEPGRGTTVRVHLSGADAES